MEASMIWRRRAIFLALALAILAAPLAVEAQQAGKTPRIGVLGSSPSPPWEALRRGLRDLGYVESQTLAIEWRWTEGKVERAPDLSSDLVRLKVDVIVTASMPVIRAVKQATSTIPIVMASSFDPVGAGLVTSLARPGGNVTGMAEMATEVVGKRAELLREAVPGLSRLAVLLGPPAPADPLFLREAEVAARALHIELQVLRARDPGEFDSAFAAMTRERASAVLVLQHPIFFAHRALLAELAVKHRLPTMHAFREFVEAGMLMSYGANLEASFQRAATYVDKILKGAKPGDLPIEQPTKFELVINLKTAKALGLKIPQSVLIRADEVIQ
jgi:putative ABC transport system substrate-binding protein